MTSRETAAMMGGFAVGCLFFLIVIIAAKPNIPTEQEIQAMERLAPIIATVNGNACK